MTKRYISKILIFFSFLVEITLVYLLLTGLMHNDFIGPENISFYEYVKIKLLQVF